MDDTADTAVVVVKQSFNEKVVKRSFSSSALQAAEGIKLEFFDNIRSQMRLASSGAGHDSFEIERSLMVGISCLPFLILSMQFFRAHFYLHGVQFLLQAWLSFQADCWSSKSKFYNIADRFSASGVILFGPTRIILRPIAGLVFKLQASFCLLVSGLVLAWSRKSKCQKDYELRHTCWHIAGFLSVYLYADRIMYNRTYDSYWPFQREFWNFGPTMPPLY